MSVNRELQIILADRLGRIAAAMVLEGCNVTKHKGGIQTTRKLLPKVPTTTGVSRSYVPSAAK
jgi:hypothetical protein